MFLYILVKHILLSNYKYATFVDLGHSIAIEVTFLSTSDNLTNDKYCYYYGKCRWGKILEKQLIKWCDIDIWLVWNRWFLTCKLVRVGELCTCSPCTYLVVHDHLLWNSIMVTPFLNFLFNMSKLIRFVHPISFILQVV